MAMVAGEKNAVAMARGSGGAGCEWKSEKGTRNVIL